MAQKLKVFRFVEISTLANVSVHVYTFYYDFKVVSIIIDCISVKSVCFASHTKSTLLGPKTTGDHHILFPF